MVFHERILFPKSNIDFFFLESCSESIKCLVSHHDDNYTSKAVANIVENLCSFFGGH